MEAILKELEKVRPSKKVLKQEFAKIQKLLEGTNNNLTDISEYDEEIYFQMVIRNKGEHNSWLEKIGDAHRYSEDELVKNAKEMIDEFNKTLRPLEKERELVRIVKHTAYKQSTTLWRLS